ncbi:MAG: hypothetical protein WC208_00265 [Gallionella sp.]|jgi:hypothetical protein
MLTLPLEPTDDRANPIFKDAAGCALWLNQLQLTNLQQAHGRLLTQINELNRYPMRALERLGSLELLRETVGHVQDELAKKLIAKPLPLNKSELAVFMSVVQLWQAMVTGYQRGLQDYISGDKSLVVHGALLCQRCLHYSGMMIFEYQRTGYEFGPGLWRQLHELYAFAEQQDLHQTEVTDPSCDRQTSCAGSYVRTLLACYASPAQMTRWQVQQMDRWLSAWSNSVTVAHRYTLSRNDAQPLAADLSGTQGLQRAEGLPHNDTLRYLAMVPLSKLLRVKTILLQQGQTPQQVGLGDKQDRHACLELLTLLHQCWCENRPQRSCERRQVSLHAALCHTPAVIYAQLTGQPFQQPDRNVAMPGHAKPGLQELENWQIKNESIMGACLIRDDLIGEGVRCKQLIAFRRNNAQSFILGAIVWTRVMTNGKLQMGVKYLPGKPEPVRIHTSGINPSKQVAPAFLLPALPSLNTPASLIIPRDWFDAGRVIEVLHQDGKVLIAHLGFSVERGLDYERVSFTAKN